MSRMCDDREGAPLLVAFEVMFTAQTKVWIWVAWEAA